ncbi:hypothetical protein V1511DRAFT_104810 [Dipodascopsis uninucleata]
MMILVISFFHLTLLMTTIRPVMLLQPDPHINYEHISSTRYDNAVCPLDITAEEVSSSIVPSDDFDRPVRNGASYRCCRDVPFSEILDLEDPGKRRPACPFTHLIALAFLSAPRHVLEIEDIYRYIINRFPYFRMRTQKKDAARWKSAVRHNLSYSKSFKKYPIVRPQNAKQVGGVKRCAWGFSDEAWNRQTLLRGHSKERKKRSRENKSGN